MTEFQSFSELYPGRFIKADLFNGEPTTYTIKAIDRDEIEGDKGKEPKIVMSFAETPLQYVLPKVCAVCIKAMFGPSVPAWIGKRVTFYATTAIMPYPKRKDEPCIRVFGSPDIADEIKCEWTPPRRKPIIQTLKPVQTPVVAKVIAAISSGKVDPDFAKTRIASLLSEGLITEPESEMLLGLIRAPEPEFNLKDEVARAMKICSDMPPTKRKSIVEQFQAEYSTAEITTKEQLTFFHELIHAAATSQGS